MIRLLDCLQSPELWSVLEADPRYIIQPLMRIIRNRAADLGWCHTRLLRSQQPGSTAGPAAADLLHAQPGPHRHAPLLQATIVFTGHEAFQSAATTERMLWTDPAWEAFQSAAATERAAQGSSLGKLMQRGVGFQGLTFQTPQRGVKLCSYLAHNNNQYL